MFKQKVESLLFLTPTSLYLYYGKKAEVSALEFPQGLIEELKVVSISDYKNLLIDALRESNLVPQRALLLFSSELLYQKTLKVEDEGQLVKEREQFFSTLPKGQALAKLSLETQGSCYEFVVNEDLINPVVESFKMSGWEVIAASPAIFYGQDLDKGLLDEKRVKQIFKDFEDSDHLSFLKTKTSEEDNRENEIKEPSQSEFKAKSYPWLTFLLSAVLIAALVGGLFTLGSIFKGNISFSENHNPSPSPVPS